MKNLKKMNMLLLVTALATGLTSGVFFTWTCSVIPGLGNLPDGNYLAAMQSINREIQNPLFFSCFIGAALLLPASAFMAYQNPVSLRFWLLVCAAAIYVIGVFGVTVAGNVPLNDALDSLELKALPAAQLSLKRLDFETVWNNLNTARTIASVIAFVLVLAAGFGKNID